ncbi:MAG TPA: methyl-accepting chemotaxis protein, partial [Geobacteraceae bacterium]|nr:methyl-accepting chemotaxis protein [Geobacteraceae bacterium]
LIAKSTADITEMIRQIKRACDEQSKGSEQIVHAVEDIRESTNTNLDAARVMDEAVAGMSGQIDLLETEMAAFKVI